MTQDATKPTIEIMRLPTGERLYIEHGTDGVLVESLKDELTTLVIRCIEIGGTSQAIVIPLNETVVDSLARDLREALDDSYTVRIRPLFEKA